GRCCRCGRVPSGTERLYVVEDKKKFELLEYGIDCWDTVEWSMKRALDQAIRRVLDPVRKGIMEDNYRLMFDGEVNQFRDSEDQEPGLSPVANLKQLIADRNRREGER